MLTVGAQPNGSQEAKVAGVGGAGNGTSAFLSYITGVQSVGCSISACVPRNLAPAQTACMHWQQRQLHRYAETQPQPSAIDTCCRMRMRARL